MIKASIVSKETHLSTTVEDVNGYVLNVASVVKLEVQAEKVRKIQLINGDLVIELINGEVITIENFNDGAKNLDNSLVLLNGATLLHINLPAHGDKEVNPQIDYLALGEVDTLLYHNEGESNLLPWIIAGGAVALGGAVAASGSGGSGSNGKDGVDGKDGQDALNVFYDYASSNGFTGSQTELVEIIMSDASNGLSAYEIAQSMGYTGTVEEWLISLQGAVGVDGKSAYQLAIENGFVGTETEWLASLSGKDGKDVILLNMPIITSDADSVLTGLAAPGVTISLFDSKGKVVATTIADENGNWSLSNTLAPNQIGQLIASDDNGAVSLPLPIINVVDTTPVPEPVVKPTLELLEVDDAVITGKATPGVTVNLYDYKGTIVATTQTDAEGNWTLSNPLAQNQIGQLIAVDDKGITSIPLPIINVVDATPIPEPVVKPTLELMGVENGVITGTATPGVTVNLYNSKGKVIGTVEVGVDGQWSMENPLPADEIGTVIATDAQGNISLPLPMIELSKPEVLPPAPTTPTTGVPIVTEADVALKGTAEAGAKITVLQNGNVIAETIADQDGNWGFEINPLPTGHFGGLVASSEGKLDSGTVIINGFVLHQTAEPVITEQAEQLAGTAQAGATIKAYHYFQEGVVVIAETVADKNGNWSFDVNPIPNDSIGHITAHVEHYLESNSVSAYGFVTPMLPNPIITYNNEDGLEGTSEPFSTVKVYVAGVAHEAVANEDGVWSFNYNPLLETSGQIIASKEGNKDSYLEYIGGFDSIAPTIDVTLDMNSFSFTFDSKNISNSIAIGYQDTNGIYKTIYVPHSGSGLEVKVNLADYFPQQDSYNIEKLDLWVFDYYNNSSEIKDISHSMQFFEIQKSSAVDGFIGMGMANSTIELTHKTSGQKFVVETGSNGNWSATIEDLNAAGISVFDTNNEFDVVYLTIGGEENTVKVQQDAKVEASPKLVEVEILEHNLDQIVLKSDPQTYLKIDIKNPVTGDFIYSTTIYTDDTGIATFSLKYLPEGIGAQDVVITTTNSVGDKNSVKSEQLYVKVTTDELVLKILGAGNATYEIESGGVKSQFTTDSNGKYVFIPNPYTNKMFTIDRIDTVGDKDIPPQEFGAVVKEPIILGVLDDHLVVDVPHKDYLIKIYDENGAELMNLGAGFGGSNSYIHDLDTIKNVIEGHQYGFTDFYLDSKFVDGQKYYLEYTNTHSGGVSGKLEFILGENGTVPNFSSDSQTPSITWATNVGRMKWEFNFPEADKVVIKVDGVVHHELDLQKGHLSTGEIGSVDYKSYEVEVYKDGELLKTEYVDTTAERPDVIVQGMDDRYIWGKATGASHIVVKIGEGDYNYLAAKQYSIPVDADGKFLIDTYLTSFKGTQNTFLVYGVGKDFSASEQQTLYMDSPNGNTIQQWGVSFSADYDTLYLGVAGNSNSQNYKLIDFKTGEVVVEVSNTSAVNNGIHIGDLDSGMYRLVVERANKEFEELQLYINEDGKAYTTFEMPTTGYNNTVYEILSYADELGGNQTTTFDLAATPDHHFNVSELLAHDYDSSKDIADFLSTVTTTDSETGQTSTSVFIDRDGTGDKFNSTELLILQNTDLNLEQLLNNGTILY